MQLPENMKRNFWMPMAMSFIVPATLSAATPSSIVKDDEASKYFKIVKKLEKGEKNIAKSVVKAITSTKATGESVGLIVKAALEMQPLQAHSIVKAALAESPDSYTWIKFYFLSVAPKDKNGEKIPWITKVVDIKKLAGYPVSNKGGKGAKAVKLANSAFPTSKVDSGAKQKSKVLPIRILPIPEAVILPIPPVISPF